MTLFHTIEIVGAGRVKTEWGWYATQAKNNDQWSLFQGHINQGGYKMPNGELSGDCGKYDPNNNEHWPDRMRAGALCVHGSVEGKLLGKGQREIAQAMDRPKGGAPMRGSYFHAPV